MNLAQIEKISKALADRTRLAVFEAIARRSGTTCGELVETEGVTPATISHHLKVLADAGLIRCSKKGQFVHSQVARGRVEEFTKALKRLSGGESKAKSTRRRN